MRILLLLLLLLLFSVSCSEQVTIVTHLPNDSVERASTKTISLPDNDLSEERFSLTEGQRVTLEVRDVSLLVELLSVTENAVIIQFDGVSRSIPKDSSAIVGDLRVTIIDSQSEIIAVPDASEGSFSVFSSEINQSLSVSLLSGELTEVFDKQLLFLSAVEKDDLLSAQLFFAGSTVQISLGERKEVGDFILSVDSLILGDGVTLVDGATIEIEPLR